MKIVFIITDFGGFNNFLGELAKELVLNLDEVHVICDRDKVIGIKDKYPYAALGIHIHHVDFLRKLKAFSWFQTSIKIKRIIEQIQPDIVNLHFTSSMFLSLLSGRIKYKSIGVFHGLGYPVLVSPIKKYIFKRIEFFCFKRLDKIALINNFDYNLVHKIYPNKAYKFQSFGVGCDLNKFNPQHFSFERRNTIKEELNIQPEDFVLMFTGRFVWFKGFDLVIRAFQYIEEKGLIKNVKLLLVGGKDKAHRNDLTEAEEEYLLNAKNILKVGFTENVDKYLSVSDLFVFPSTKEGMPVAIMEAIAMGVPVVTLDSRGCNDIISNDFNGKLLDVNADFVEIANSIGELYQNKEKLSILSENALKQRENFDRNLFVKESIELFKNSL
jgi:glycosyltransferase involved in cell wall biosynthesis